MEVAMFRKTHTSRPDRPQPGIAARLGGWSARHRMTAILLWIGLVVVGIVLAGAGQRTLSSADQSNGDSATAQRLLDSSGFKRPAAEQVLIQAPRGESIRTPAGERAARDVIAAVTATGRVENVRSPFAAGNRGQISADGRSALVLFAMKGDPATANKRVQPVVAAVDRVAHAQPGLHISEFGSASARKALDDTIGKDFSRAETLSIPLTFLILWLTFAAVVAALLPIVLALTAILIASGIVAVTSHGLPIDDSASSMILLIGLAVGVDYSLFSFRRAREERARGVSNRTAVEIAAATSGKAVLTSGMTVIIAMAAMFLTGQGTFMGMAEATAIVVAVAMLGSLTVLPAMLALLGDRVEAGRIPFLGRRLARRRTGGESRVWSAVLRPALSRPVATAVAAAGLLVVLAVPAFRLQTAVPGASDLPQNLPVIKTFNRIQHAFPGGPAPVVVVVSARDVTAPAMQDAIARLKHDALASGQMHDPITVDVNPRRTLAAISVPLVGTADDQASRDALQTLRGAIIPKTVGRVGTAYVTGGIATTVDFNHQLHSRQWYVIGVVLGLAFLLLMWTFRSIVIPATAIVLNLLSVGAAYGVLVSVFQGGWGIVHVPGVHHGPIASYLPLFLFVVLFGLSMDYHVFILSRIREGHDRGLATKEAIRRGIITSAGVVTSAAIIMVAVFSTFATLSVVSMQQLGVGLAVAVLLDATIVRGLLVPAVMTMLGERNWYLPRWLEWVPGERRRAPAGAATAALPVTGAAPGRPA